MNADFKGTHYGAFTINMGYKSVLCLSRSRLQLIEVVGMKYFENKWLCVNRLIY